MADNARSVPAETTETPSSDTAAPHPNGSRADRVLVALRQAAILAACLVVVGAMVGALRPDQATSRDIVSSPFMWAAAVWALVLLFDAARSQRSQIGWLDRQPMSLGALAAGFTLVVGLIGFNDGSFAQRIVYVIANALGAFIFWWAIFALLWLLVRESTADDAYTSDTPASTSTRSDQLASSKHRLPRSRPSN